MDEYTPHKYTFITLKWIKYFIKNIAGNFPIRHCCFYRFLLHFKINIIFVNIPL